MVTNDELICSICLSPACAAGELMCEAAQQASLKLRAAIRLARVDNPWPDAPDPIPQVLCLSCGSAACAEVPDAETALRMRSAVRGSALFPAGYPVAMVVYGLPKPQGSKVPGYSGKGPARRMTYMREAAGHALERWRADIIAQCQITMRGRDVLDGPLRAALTFSLKYPDRPRKGTPAYLWPEAPAGPPDADKLARAVGDALKIGGVIVDDARITGYDRLEKVWAGSGEVDSLPRPGVVIRVRRR